MRRPEVFLNEHLVAIAGPKVMYQHVEINFLDGDVLKIGEYETAVLVLTKVLVSCEVLHAPSGKPWCNGTLTGSGASAGCGGTTACASHYTGTSTPGLYLQCGLSSGSCLALGPTCEQVPV
ncbi:unnamed protein product [Effrenium voratum]|nr:unnamed protein product [Effrenium voratum]